MRRRIRSLSIVLAMIALRSRLLPKLVTLACELGSWSSARRPDILGSATKEDVMAVNTSFAQVNAGAQSNIRPSLGQLLSVPARTARRAGRRAFDYFAQDAATAREHRQRNVFEATGWQRGPSASSEVVQFDLVDRYRAGF